MVDSLTGLRQPSYSHNQLKEPAEYTSPNSRSRQERAASLGFHGDSQIPAVTDREQSQLERFHQGTEPDSRNFDSYECQTCKRRKYQDGSNDPGVSYKTPTNIAPEQAASSIRAHENEHVVREQAKAQREGRKVVSQSVTYHSSICPECGKVYISGGTTRTVTKDRLDHTYGLKEDEKETGQYLDLTA